jgi:hypothetical protein
MYGTGYLFEPETTKTDLLVTVKSFDWQTGKLLAQKPIPFGATAIGISNGIVYQQASKVSTDGKDPRFTDTVYAIRLTDGSTLWQYSIKNLKAGNIGEPGVMAP